MSAFRTSLLGTVALLGFVCHVGADGWAQNYPAKPIRLVVANSPGSNADFLARIIAPELGGLLGQQVFVDNHPGAGTTIGTELVARAQPDGYTLLSVNMPAAVNETLYPKRNYNLIRDFTAITQLVSSSSLLVVHPSLPVKSVGELVKLAKAKPGVINVGHAGVGSVTFLAAELFKTLADVDVALIPYRGGGEVVNALVSGEVSVYFAPLTPVLSHVRAGRLRAIAALNNKRLKALPQYPTIGEAGYPDFKCDSWYGLLAPAKTPTAIIDKIHHAALDALNKPDVIVRFDQLGFTPIGNQPQEFANFIKSQVDMWGTIVRRTGIASE